MFLELEDEQADEVESKFKEYLTLGWEFDAERAAAAVQSRAASVGRTQRKFVAAKKRQESVEPA